MSQAEQVVSIIIPAFNEERSIQQVLDRVCALRFERAKTEIVVVNDGSSDATRQILDRYRFPPDVRGIVFHSPANFGKGGALRNGIGLANGAVLAFQDGDLELDPDDLPKLVAPVLAGQAEVVYGSRFKAGFDRSVPAVTRWANWFLTRVTNVLYAARLTDMACGYKILSRATAARLRLRATGFEIEPEITAKLLRLGYKIQELPVSYKPRSVAEGKKVRWHDGVMYLRVLARIRFSAISACQQRAATEPRELLRASADALHASGVSAEAQQRASSGTHPPPRATEPLAHEHRV